MKHIRHPVVLALLLFGLALLPRVFALGSGLTTDEAYHWVAYRSADFLAALSSGRFADTIITGHPGVTTMWLGSAGLLLEQALTASGLLSDMPFETHLALMRLPMALATALAVATGYLLLRGILGPTVALVAALLWASDPFLVAHSRLLHLDAPLAMLMLLATLALMGACFTQQGAYPQPRPALLVLSGVASGLALVTKSPGVLLVPVAGLTLLAWLWHQRHEHAVPMLLRRASLAGLLWGGVALLTAFAAWPALWVAPWPAVASVLEEITSNAGAPHPGTFLLGTHYITDEPGMLFYPVTLFGRLTPWVVAGLCALLLASVQHWPWLRAHRMPLLLLAGAALLLPLALTIPPKKFDRYALPSIPLLHTLAAAGLVWLGTRLPLLPRRIAIGLTSATAAITLLLFHPYYLAYYNPLIGGSFGAPALVPVGWGEGLDQVADWLNTRPDLERGQVATWSPPTLAAYLDAPTTWQGAIETGVVSYMVVYVNQDQTRKESQYFGDIQAACAPVHTTSINGIDYAWVYRVPTYTPRLQAPVRFGDVLTLSDSILVPPAACSCEPHTLTLVFKPLRTPEQPLFLFLHVVDAAGNRIFQADLPLDSLIPSTAWQSSTEVPYTLQVAAPADAPDGTYRVLLGLYNPADGERLSIRPAQDAAAAPTLAGPDTLRVVTFEHLADQRPGCETR